MKKTALRKVSLKRRKINQEYARLQKEFLAAHPFCQVFLHKRGIHEAYLLVCFRFGIGPRISKIPASTEIHHKKGRGKYLLDTSTWMAVSRDAHLWIHDNPKEARELGYIIRR